MNSFRAIWAVLILVCQTGPAAAYFQDGNALYESCQNPAEQGYCLGYIVGIADAFGVGEHRFCFPDHVKQGQLRDVVMLYLTNHPESRHRPAASLVIYSFNLTSTFRCEQ
jgi:hypothetical protein